MKIDMSDLTLLTAEQREELDNIVKKYSLDCKRYAVRYCGKMHYVGISLHNDKPIEVFISSARETDSCTASSISALTRFITMALKAYPLSIVIKQLNRASLTHRDLPGLLAKLLNGDYLLL